MPFSRLKKIIRFAGSIVFFLALFIISGCVAQKPESVNSSESINSSINSIDREAAAEQARTTDEAVPILRKITAVDMNVSDQSIDIHIQGNQKLVYT